MLLKLTQFLKKHQEDIVLLIGVILISLFSFAIGFIVAKQQEKTPLRIERPQSFFYANEKSKSSNYWSWNMRALFGSKTI
ncbi:MAG: hypothetical protein IB617_02070 [Candidatus Nealsonbacteria bacterium]|nr:MAG: hypothetical protein IB617_02070 [Candidatus Nealsonbacteria bacterium]